MRDLAEQFDAAAKKNEAERKAGLPETGFIVRTRGRPVGWRKPDAKHRRIFARINAEQSAKFDHLAGETDTDKLRGLLDSLPAI